METKLLLTFIVFNIINVIIQTVKSIATIKCGKTVAALVNAVAYGLYTYIVVLTVCNLPLWVKVVTVGLANLVGVYVVKYFEEKGRKDRLWKVEATIPTEFALTVDDILEAIPHSYIRISPKHTLFNIYCATQNESKRVKEIINEYNAKYFVAESKEL